MQNKSTNIFLLSALSLLLLCPTISSAWLGDPYGDWDYHGSGRDHPYSAYIDRANYVGPADYAPIPVDYIDGPLVISNVPAPPPITPAPAVLPTPPEQFVVNIPNTQGGFNAVVIQRSGDGYVGPNGEYYPEFPKVFQLQMKYGK